jgi:hypothetical protein
MRASELYPRIQLERFLAGDEVLEQYRRTIRIERSYGQDIRLM